MSESKLEWQFNLGKGMSDGEIRFLAREIKDREYLGQENAIAIANLIVDMHEEKHETVAKTRDLFEECSSSLKQNILKRLMADLSSCNQHIIRDVLDSCFDEFDGEFEDKLGIR